MREILFRGKFGNEWKYGYLSVEPKGLVIKEPYNDNKSEIWHIEPETVCQFTGLTDKNGRKIFEGDIVRYTSDLGNTHTCTVSYHEACAMFVLNFINSKTISDFMISSACACEVIGNIFDNPELLEVNQNG